MAQGKRIQRKPKKTIAHRFLDRYTVPGTLLLTLWGYLGSQILLGTVLSLPLQLVLPVDHAVELAAAAGALILLAIHKRWFYPEFEGCLPGRDFRPVLPALALMFAALWLPSVIQNAVEGALGMPTLATVSMSLMAGISEEVAFRGIPGSYLMRQWREERKIPAAMVITSLLFSLVHAANLFVGAAFGSTFVQLLTSFGIGMLLCAVFLRTGSLLPCMLLHITHDIVAFLSTSYSDGVMTAEMDVLSWILNLGTAILMLVLALCLTRPSKRKDILAIWTDKWGGAEIPVNHVIGGAE